jgi:hypothetical protein
MILRRRVDPSTGIIEAFSIGHYHPYGNWESLIDYDIEHPDDEELVAANLHEALACMNLLNGGTG